MKKLSKTIENKINEINNLLPLIDNLEHFAITYNYGTYPCIIDILPIEIKGMKVIIKAKDLKNENNYFHIEKYNTNNTDKFETNGLVHLKFELSTILKSFKSALKKQNQTLKSNKMETIREYYIKNYPYDALGLVINENAKFENLWAEIRSKKVCSYLGTYNSVILGRIFKKFSQITGHELIYIYQEWLNV